MDNQANIRGINQTLKKIEKGEPITLESDPRYKNYIEAPVLEFYDETYLEAFMTLAKGRESFNGHSHIPYEAITIYLNEEEIPREQRKFFRTVIETVDENYYNYMRQKQEASIKAKQNKVQWSKK